MKTLTLNLSETDYNTIALAATAYKGTENGFPDISSTEDYVRFIAIEDAADTVAGMVLTATDDQ
jgi:hypothetical protein